MTAFAYAFASDKAAKDEFPRVLKLISTRLAKLKQDSKSNLPEALHEVRRLIKLTRALLWFAKPALPPAQASRAKKQLRAAAQTLSEPRDLEVVRTTLGELRDEVSLEKEQHAIRQASQVLTAHANGSNGPRALQGILSRAVREVQKALQLLEPGPEAKPKWKSPQKQLDRAFRQMEKARQVALKSEDPDEFHAWRKKAKRLLYLLQVLQGDPKPKVSRTIKRVDKIQHQLGGYHDSVILEDKLKENRSAGLEKAKLKPLLKLLDDRKRRLQRKTERVARRLA